MTEEIHFRDPVFIQKLLKWIMPPLRFAFGCKVSGFEKLPDGNFILISNHNIGAPIEIFALLDSWEKTRRSPVYGLTHRFSFKIPLLRPFVQKIGSIPASFEATHETLRRGFSLIVFPGGAEEAFRTFTDRNKCDFYDHQGWAKIALETQIRIVPIAVSGSHSINPVLLRSRALATFLVVPKLLGISYFPVTLSQIVFSLVAFFIFHEWANPLLTILAIYVAFLLTPLTPLYPSKINIQVGEPLDPNELASDPRYGKTPIDRIYARVIEEIQRSLTCTD